MGAPVAPGAPGGGAAGRGGALYTGRGPVCGTIIRGPRASGGGDAIGRCAEGGVGGCPEACKFVVCAAGGVAAGGAAADGADAGGATARGGTALVGGGTVATGRDAGDGGKIIRGGGALAGGAETGADGFAMGATVAFTSGTGGVGRATGADGAGAAACCLPMIAFSTSPGLEMCERSILVLIPSGSVRFVREEKSGAASSLSNTLIPLFPLARNAITVKRV